MFSLLKKTFIFFVGALLFLPVFALADGHSFSDEGVNCHISLLTNWKSYPPVFGFSTLLIKEKSKEQRASLGVVITPIKGIDFDQKNLEKQFQDFQEAKKKYAQDEGGRYLGEVQTLDGKNQNHIFKISVKYIMDKTEYRDSSYFRYVNGQMIHAKVLFPTKVFQGSDIETEVTTMLGAMTCAPQPSK